MDLACDIHPSVHKLCPIPSMEGKRTGSSLCSFAIELCPCSSPHTIFLWCWESNTVCCTCQVYTLPLSHISGPWFSRDELGSTSCLQLAMVLFKLWYRHSGCVCQKWEDAMRPGVSTIGSNESQHRPHTVLQQCLSYAAEKEAPFIYSFEAMVKRDHLFCVLVPYFTAHCTILTWFTNFITIACINTIELITLTLVFSHYLLLPALWAPGPAT